jgi:hypothetical protein
MRKGYNLKVIRGAIILWGIILTSLPVKSQITFQKLYGGARIESARDLEICPNGDFLLVGTTTSFSPGDSDVYVLRVDKEGNKLFEKAIGGRGNEMAYSVRSTNDGNFIVGGFTSSYGAGGYDAYLLKITPSGDVIWSKTYGSSGSDIMREASPTSDGGFILSGYSNSKGNYDAFLIKTDASGNEQWRKYYGGTGTDMSFSVKQSPDEGFIFFGTTYSQGAGGGDFYLVKTDIAGNVSWTKVFGGPAAEEGQFVQCTSDGGYIVVGDQESNSAGGYDINVTKFNGSGGQSWTKLFGGAQKDVGKMVQPTTEGGYVISGITRSFGLKEPDFWIIKIDGGGGLQWQKTYGYAYHEHCYPVKQTSDGGYIAAGHSDSPPSAGIDALLIKTDGQGNMTVGIEENGIAAVLGTYPNPAAEKLNIDLSALPREDYKLVFINSLGQEVYTESISRKDLSERREINIASFPRGLYLLNLRGSSDRNLISRKLVFK